FFFLMILLSPFCTRFPYTTLFRSSFKWANLASHNAGVIVVIVGIAKQNVKSKKIFSINEEGDFIVKEAKNINAYLVAGSNVFVDKVSKTIHKLTNMPISNTQYDYGHLLIDRQEYQQLIQNYPAASLFIKRIKGSAEFIRGIERYCIWIEDEVLDKAMDILPIKQRVDRVRKARLESPDKSGRALALRAHQMRETNQADAHVIVIPSVSSENRAYLPVGVESKNTIVSNLAFAMYDEPLWNMAIL